MAITTETIFDSVSTTLLDAGRNAWTRPELVGYLNEAMRATAFLKPDMYSVQDFLPLVAGIAQELPDGGVALIDITDNEVSGRAVTPCDLSILQQENRFWPAATQETDAENYAADPRTPRRYYVFPPNDGTGSVRVTYGAVPPELTGSSGETLPVPDSYQSPLTNFMLAKCYGKNSKRQDLTKYAGYMNDWRMSLGLKSQAQVAVAPKLSQTPGVT